MAWPERPETLNVTTVKPADRPGDDMRRWRIAVDDGTIPGQVEVRMTATNATEMEAGEPDADEWIREQVRRKVSDVPGGKAAQLSALRALGPLDLTWVG